MTDATAASTRQPINFQEKLGKLQGFWQPRVIAEMNDYQFKLVRIEGDFIGTIIQRPTRPSSFWRGSCGSIFAMVPSMSDPARCSSSRRAWSTSLSPRRKSG